MGMPISVIVLQRGFVGMIKADCSDKGVWMALEGLGLEVGTVSERSRCGEKAPKEIRDYLGLPVSFANVNVKT
jgi:hypothetical protein